MKFRELSGYPTYDIKLALEKMQSLKKNIYEDTWIDNDEHTEGLIIISEALLSYLIPALKVKNLKEHILKTYGEEILDGLRKILILSESNFSGLPYWKEAINKFGEDEPDFLESTAYVIQTLVIAKKLVGAEKLKQMEKEIDNTIERALKAINECFMDDENNNGWTFVNKDKCEPYLYCCWTAAEVYGTLNNTKYNLIKQIPAKGQSQYRIFEKNIDKMKSWLESRHIKTEDEDLDITNDKGKPLSFDASDNSFYYNLWVIVALIRSKSEKKDELKTALEILETNYISNARTKDNYNKLRTPFNILTKTYIREGSDVDYSERAFIPLAINATILLKMLGYKVELNNLLNELTVSLMDNRLEDEFSNVWDKWGQKGYSIFYTKRSIEALSLLFEYLTSLTTSDDILKLSVEIPNQQLNLFIDALISNDDFISRIVGNSKLVEKINTDKKLPPINPELESLKEAVEGTNA